jgi:hypothetical protein
LINPLDSPVRALQLGSETCFLEHIGLVYNTFTIDEHGLTLEDIHRTDLQNWAFAQRICQSKVRACLARLRYTGDTHQEHTLGIEVYLGACANYFDIFLSPTTELRTRVVLALKVSFFFRLWKLWIKFGDHNASGNVAKVSVSDSFVSHQCFLDVQISCHFVVLLIMHFQVKYPHLAVPLHLIGFDSCKIFFSKIGGMCGMERAYDFSELLNCANTLNHLSAIEYGENGLKFGKVHNKMTNVWAHLHPLMEGQTLADLGDYSSLQSEANFVLALQEGLSEAQKVLLVVNMKPCRPRRGKLTVKEVAEGKWFTEP